MFRVLTFLCLSFLFAQGELFKTRIGDLKVDEKHEKILEAQASPLLWRGGYRSGMPIARFPNFAFVVPDFEVADKKWLNNQSYQNYQKVSISEGWLVLDIKDRAGRKGHLDVWKRGQKEWEVIPCEIDPAKLKDCSVEESKFIREWYDRHQLAAGVQGGLWYRGRVSGEVRDQDRSNFDETYTTFSGGRALAENLALDRDLILGQGKKGEDVAISEIKGVTVAAIPWKDWMPKGEIVVDALSKRVPEDQHLLVVPSLKKLLSLVDRVEEDGAPILQSFSEGEPYRGLPLRYRSQMGLDLPQTLARFLPIGGVAVTGGDPFFPTGSDVAVILETEKVDFVYSAIKGALSAKAKVAGAKAVGGAGEVGFQNEDRSFSSHVAKLDGAIVIANSARQIARLKAVAKGKIHNLGSTDEYRYFRHRYPVEKSESAYVFISDACLRRWSGPRVRIGASRRSRALSALAKVTSGYMMTGDLDQSFEPLLGKVTLANDRIVSARYGSLGFVTPTGELDLEKVSVMEKEGYESWREGYETGWSKFFDPIAIQLKFSDEREELDMTILPLRVDSDFQEVIALAGKASLSAGASAVPGESIFHFAMAVDKESDEFKRTGVSLLDLVPSLSVNPLGWMGESVSVTLGDSLIWKTQFVEESIKDMPALLRVDVESRLKLALFMTAVKGAIEGAGPGLVEWETRKHGEIKYVAMLGDVDEMGLDISLFYATLPNALLISLNEDMLKRAIDREGTLKKALKGKPEKRQFMVQTSPQFLSSIETMFEGDSLSERRRFLSYQALPILNEWFKVRGAKDPVAFHETRFGELINCPGGPGFRWNEKDLTMESVAFGHPGGQRHEAKPMPVLDRFKTMTVDGNFEEGGVRMRVAFDQKSHLVLPDLKSKPRPADDEVVKIGDLYPMTPGTVMKYESESTSQGDEEPSVQKSEVRIEAVKKVGAVYFIDELYVNTWMDDEFKVQKDKSKSRYEVGPKGSRMLSMNGDFEMIPDKEAYDFPGELWPGQVFRVRKEEIWIEDGKRVPSRSNAIVSVIGWEKIAGPEGKELKALKIKWNETSIHGADIDRRTVTEWLVPSIGMVKSENRGSWDNTKEKLVEIKRPK